MDFHDRMNVFVGDNGQGKTNIIEALVYLSFGRSFRVNDDKLLIQYDQEFAKIHAISDMQDETEIVISNTGKYITRNGAVLKRLSDLIGHVNVVVFHPDDLNFFSHPPRMRRREIDYELGKFDPSTIQLINTQRKLMSLRNAALKSESVDLAYLDIIDQQLIEVSIPLIQKRHAFIQAIETKVQRLFQALTNDTHDISIEYQTLVSLDEDLQSALETKMQQTRSRDLAFKQSHVGVHRDDYTFMMNGQKVQDSASQGQRRLLILAYKFALIEFFKENKGVTPILCLDDLFSELDHQKRTTLFQFIPDDVQVFISTTDQAFIDPSIQGKVFVVHHGNIIKEALL